MIKRPLVSLALVLALLGLWCAPVLAARLIDESFEGIGYEDSGWTETIGAGNALDADHLIEEDVNGRMPLGAGTECLKINLNGTTTNDFVQNIKSNINYSSGRTFIKINACAWVAPSNGDYIQASRTQDSAGAVVIAPVIYYNGSNYQFRIRYSDASVKIDTSGYTYTLNTWYRIEWAYDATNKHVWFDIYDLDSNNLFTRSFGFSGSSRIPNRYTTGIANPGETVTAEILYDLAVFDNATYPIGVEDDHTFTVTELLPTALGSITDWSYAGKATKLECVNESVPDDDAGYIYTSNPSSTQTDLYTFYAAPPASPGVILAVRQRVKAKALPGGSDLRLVCYIDGVTYRPPHAVRPSYNNYYYYCWDWELNPATGKPWTWAEVLSFAKFGVEAGINLQQGGRVTSDKLRVIHGSYKHRYSNASPVCGGMETSRMKVFARVARPPLVADAVSWLKLAYSPHSDLSDPDETTAVQVTSSSDWTHIFTVSTYDPANHTTPLSPDTTYYFDVLVSPDGTTNWRSYHDDFSLSYYPRYKTHPTTGNVTFAVNSDQHGSEDCNVAESIVADNPGFVIDLGDVTGNATGSLVDCRDEFKGLYMSNEYWQENILHKKAFETTWDDHDYYDNNATKFISYKADMFRGYLEHRPIHDFPSGVRLTGTATGTAANKLIDSGKTFTSDTVHALATYGGAYIHNVPDDTWAMVTAIDTGQNGHQLSLSADIMASGEGYEILNGVSRSFTAGCAEFFLPDLRSQRDDGPSVNHTIQAPGADMFDGVLTVALTTLADAKDSGSITSKSGNTITETGQNFLSTVSVGDIITDYSQWAYVVSVDSDIQLTLNAPIFDGAVSYNIYESGASHGANSHGHINRDWFIDAIEDSTAEWRIICSSVSWNGNANRHHDQWGDYDDYPTITKDLQRTYINSSISNSNDVAYLSSNTHYAALDSGTDTEPTGNMWPEMCTAQPGDAELEDHLWDIGMQGVELGTATGATTSTLSDSGKSWTPDELIGFVITITGGTGAYQSRLITDNTATQVTVSPNWTTTPSTNSIYEINVQNYGLVELTETSAALHAYRWDGTEFSFSPLEINGSTITIEPDADALGVTESDPTVVTDCVVTPATDVLQVTEPDATPAVGIIVPVEVDDLGMDDLTPGIISGARALPTADIISGVELNAGAIGGAHITPGVDSLALGELAATAAGGAHVAALADGLALTEPSPTVTTNTLLAVLADGLGIGEPDPIITTTAGVTDNFNRANETPLAGNWSTPSGGWASLNLASNVVKGSSYHAQCVAYWAAASFNNDQWASCKVITNADDDAGPMVRISAAAKTGYLCSVAAVDNTIKIYKCVAGSYTYLAGEYVTVGAGDVVKITAVGTTLTVYVNDVSKVTCTDSAIASGSPGIYLWGNLCTVDDFKAGNLSDGVTVTPATDGLALAEPSPTVNGDLTIQPSADVLEITEPAPTVIGSGGETILDCGYETDLCGGVAFSDPPGVTRDTFSNFGISALTGGGSYCVALKSTEGVSVSSRFNYDYTAASEIYVRMYVFVPTAFTDGGTYYALKMFRYTTPTPTEDSDVMVDGGTGSTWKMRWSGFAQEPYTGAAWYGPGVPSAGATKNAWHYVEWHFKKQDGNDAIDVWVDKDATTETPDWSETAWNVFLNDFPHITISLNWSGDVSPATQSWYMDGLQVSTAPIGDTYGLLEESAGVTVTPAADSLALGEPAATATGGVLIAAGPDDLDLIDSAAAVTTASSVTVLPGTDSLAGMEPSPVAIGGAHVTTGVDSLALNEPTGTGTGGARVAALADGLILTEASPAITASTFLAVLADSLTLGEPDATVQVPGGAMVQALADALALAELGAGATGGALSQPASDTPAATEPDVTVLVRLIVTPAPEALSVEEPAPTVITNCVVTPAADVLILAEATATMGPPYGVPRFTYTLPYRSRTFSY